MADDDNDKKHKDTNNDSSGDVYRALVVDSGPIIRLTGMSTALRGHAMSYYTVPAVMDEIRDAKAREHLDQLPFQLQTREASPEGIQAVVKFARLTGDYHSLSAVDLQVLGLLYDLEREGCHGNMDHVGTTPKRTVGLGKIETLAATTETSSKSRRQEKSSMVEEEAKCGNNETAQTREAFQQRHEQQPQETVVVKKGTKDESNPNRTTGAPKSWAMLVNTKAATAPPPIAVNVESHSTIAQQDVHERFGSMNLVENDEMHGQFSDADEEDDNSLSSDNDKYANSEREISDEECDVYVLDPEEVVEHRKKLASTSNERTLLNDELQSDFPSLTASLQVPYEESGDDDEDDKSDADPIITAAVRSKQMAEKKKEEALKPVSKSGKRYNSFRNYKELMKPKPKTKLRKETTDNALQEGPKQFSVDKGQEEPKQATAEGKDGQSRIIGGMAMAGQGTEVDDDGEGWIMSSADIRKMKAAGRLNPSQNPNDLDRNAAESQTAGPPVCQRAACTTTDFAMQNVILQMNLELLSVDGIKVRRLKSWVTRCGACYTVVADGDDFGPNNTKRLFCSRCGSDMLQRVAASVDGKTGRLRLHLSKKYKTSLRGTKFSLPKPGTGNRFQGDLLLREDQLLMGAWNQKVKQRSGGKARKSATSMFGSDLASTVGCNARSIKSDDIQVGFGRRNPNATKYGRERRGKRKKSSDKACGLRRY